MSSSLSKLKLALEAAINSNSIKLPNTKVPLKVRTFLQNMLKTESISIKKAKVTGTDTSVTLTGTWRAFGVTLNVTWTFEDKDDAIVWTFSAEDAGPTKVSSIVKYFLVFTPSIPKSIANLAVTNLKLAVSISETTNDYQLELDASTAQGTAALVVEETSGKLGAAFGIDLKESFQLSFIGDSLSVFNELEFENPAIIISDFENKDLKLVGIQGVKKGIEFRSILELTNTTSSSIIGKIVNELSKGLQGIPVDVSMDLSKKSFALEAEIKQSFSMPGYKKLKLTDVDFKLDTSPAASLSGTLAIPITIPADPDVTSIDVTGAINYTEKDGTENVGATLNSNTKIIDPFHVKGFTLKDVGFGIDASFGAETGVGVVIEGDFLLGRQQLEEKFILALDFDDDLPNPSLLSVEAHKLNLGTIFKALIAPTLSLPEILKGLVFNELTLYWCDKAQTAPDGTKCEPGVGYNAALSLWGFDTYSALNISQSSGISGQASIDPINLLDGKVTVTGDGKAGHGVKAGGAYMDFDTSKETFDANLNANIFGLKEVVDAHISSKSLQINIDSNLGFFKNNLAVHFNGLSNMGFSEQIDVALDCHPTIKVGGINLGTIHIDSSLQGSISASVQNEVYKANVKGSFQWNSYSFGFSFDLSADLSRLDNLATAIENKIVSEATSIFSSYFNKVTNYIKAYTNDLLEGGEFVLNVLYHVYGYSVDQLISFMEDLEEGVHVDGSPDFKIDIQASIPAISEHIDMGHVTIIPHVDGTIIIHGDTPHGDIPLSTTITTPRLDIELLDINVGGHFDLEMPPTAHADATTPNIHADEHLDFFGYGGRLSGGGTVGIDTRVSLDNLNLKARLNFNAHASISAIVHGDISQHIDVQVP